MKASTKFGTDSNPAHLPSNMRHTTGAVCAFTVEEDNVRFVVLTLEQLRNSNYKLSVRMTAQEAQAMSTALARAVNGEDRWQTFGN